MAKENELTYEQALARLDAIVAELEHTEALSMDVFRTKAQESKQLLTFCRKQLTDWEKEVENTMQ